MFKKHLKDLPDTYPAVQKEFLPPPPAQKKINLIQLKVNKLQLPGKRLMKQKNSTKLKLKGQFAYNLCSKHVIGL